jgi:hypothetical protein
MHRALISRQMVVQHVTGKSQVSTNELKQATHQFAADPPPEADKEIYSPI